MNLFGFTVIEHSQSYPIRKMLAPQFSWFPQVTIVFFTQIILLGVALATLSDIPVGLSTILRSKSTKDLMALYTDPELLGLY